MKNDIVKQISLALVGDVLISKRLPRAFSDTLQNVSDILKAQECCFGNLETTIHRREGYPEAFPGGSYAMADPYCLNDLVKLGFNVFNTANNHSMDYSHEGLLATLRHLEELGIPHCGTGKNLANASLPAYIECTNGRVAFIGVTSSFHDSYVAGPQNQDLQGRPGVAPLRHKAVYTLEEERYNDLYRIASLTGINNYHDQARKEGYLPKSEEFKFGTFNFIKGDKNSVITTPNEQDLQRTIATIKDALYHTEIVVVSIHSHQFKGIDKHNTPDFIRIFAQKCIDAGATIVVCHGPHVMRGIEVYNKGLIFHGLGNFILQHETMTVVGEEQYWKSGMTRQTSTGVGGLINARDKGGKMGLSADSDAWISFFVVLKYCFDKIDVMLFPIVIDRHFNNGLPSISKDPTILKKVIELSSEWGTNISIDKESNIGLLSILKDKSQY